MPQKFLPRTIFELIAQNHSVFFSGSLNLKIPLGITCCLSFKNNTTLFSCIFSTSFLLASGEVRNLIHIQENQMLASLFSTFFYAQMKKYCIHKNFRFPFFDEIHEIHTLGYTEHDSIILE